MKSREDIDGLFSNKTSANPARKSFKRSTLYNLGGSLTSMALSVCTVPLFLHKIGAERYGVLAIIWLFVSYFSVFDLGLSRATVNQIAKSTLVQERVDIFWTAILLNAGIGFFGGAVLFLGGGIAFQYVFKMPISMHAAVKTMMPWLAICVPIATVTGVLTGVLEGCERFFLVNALQVFGTVLLQIVPLAVAYLHGPQLVWLIAAVIGTRAATTIPLIASVLIILPVGRPRLPIRRWVRELFGYGIWVTISNLIVPFLISLDKFMIGGILGLSSVTYYSVPERFTRQASVFPAALTRTLFPRISAGEHQDAKATSLRVFTIAIAILTPITVLLILVIRPFLAIWIDPRFAALAGPVGLVVSAAIWINGLAFVPSSFLQARGRPDLTAKYHMMEILPHIALLWFALHRFGLVGGAWALLFINSVDAGLLFHGSKMKVWCHSPFWQGVSWVVVAIMMAYYFPAIHAFGSVMAVIVLILTIIWGVSISADVKELIHLGVQYIRLMLPVTR